MAGPDDYDDGESVLGTGITVRLFDFTLLYLLLTY
jgi:hypothetical protein